MKPGKKIVPGWPPWDISPTEDDVFVTIIVSPRAFASIPFKTSIFSLESPGPPR